MRERGSPRSGNPPWRPSDLTPEVADAVASLVRGGNKPIRAAMARGIPRSTFYYWMARGRTAASQRSDALGVPELEQPFLDFLDAVERAESESQVIVVSHLMRAMPSTPTAAFAWLERRFPQEWSRTERVEHAGGDGGAIAVRIETVRGKVLSEIEAIRQRMLEDTGELPQGRTSR
jgi:hypothetical protein